LVEVFDFLRARYARGHEVGHVLQVFQRSRHGSLVGFPTSPQIDVETTLKIKEACHMIQRLTRVDELYFIPSKKLGQEFIDFEDCKMSPDANMRSASELLLVSPLALRL
jgi:hypothetical protein